MTQAPAAPSPAGPGHNDSHPTNVYSLLARARDTTGLPLMELRMLLCHVTGWSKTQLITRDKENLDHRVAEQFDALSRRRAQGVPMAYLMGYREFYRRNFKVSEDTLIPRPETEELIDLALAQWPAGQPATVLDIGTGSGIIAITLKLERPHWTVHASDISQRALDMALINTRSLQADVHLFRSDYCSHIPSDVSFDIIVSNPPYIAANDGHLLQGDLRFEPRTALTDEGDGFAAYRALAVQAMRHVKPGGLLLVEHGYAQQIQIMELFNKAGWQAVLGHKDLSGNPRIVSAKAPSILNQE